MTTTVSDIEHIESQSLNGVGSHQGLLSAACEYRQRGRAGNGDLPGAAAPASAGHQPAFHHSVQRFERAGADAGPLRDGTERAAAVRYRARTPSAPNWPPSRARRHPIPMAASSGRSRWISIRTRLQATGLSPADVVNAISAQNLIAPVGHDEDGPVRVRDRDQLGAHHRGRS